MTGHEEGVLSGRSDFQAIAAWVRPDSTVLDLGCDRLEIRTARENAFLLPGHRRFAMQSK